MMAKRSKVDLGSAIVRNPRTWEMWMTVATKIQIPEGMPSEIIGHEREFRTRLVDITLGDGIMDAVQAGWVVVGPVLARTRSEMGMFPYHDVEVIERKVRVQPIEAVGSGYVRTTFPKDPLPEDERWPWAPYEPTYDDGRP
jgi:hypothetical protein